MNIFLYVLATFLLAVAAYFLGNKQSKHAFQFLCEDNGNFSLTRLVVLISNISFLFVFVYIAMTKGVIINPSWTICAYMVFINLLKILQKHFESNPEMINEIIQILRKK